MKYIAYLGVIIVGLVLAVFLFNTEYLSKIELNKGKLKISTSFYPLYFLTEGIVKDKADVVNITPAGAEPHDYDLSAGDRVNIDTSNILILVGKNFEPWGKKIEDSLQGTNTKVLSLNESNDPHFWLSPRLAVEKASIINESLKQTDPVNAKIYDENYSRLQKKLSELDVKFRAELGKCKKKDIITTHAAFGYLARDYGLNQISLSGLSPDEEPSAKTIASIADFAKRNNIKYIFFESLVSPKLADTVANEIGAKILVLNPIEGLTKQQIASGDDYIKEMENNLNNLKTALECQ